MAYLEADIRDYDSAQEFLGTALDRTLGHNTWISADPTIGPETSVTVWLHSTAVVRFYSNGTVRLSSGGWQTVTTMDRIRQTLPVGFHLDSRGGAWYIVDRRPNRFPEREASFVDGMLIDTATRGNPFGG